MRLSTVTGAILISLSGIFLLDLMGLIIKHLSERYPAAELAVFRNLFGIVPSLILLAGSAEWRRRPSLRMRQWPIAVLRGLFVTVAQFCFYLALGRLAFATASTLVFAMPLFTTALSVPLLGARVGPLRWLAVAIGFAGVVMVMRPGSDVFTLDALLPVAAALGYALTTVTVRLIDEDLPNALLNLHSNLAAMAGATVLTLSTTGFVAVASVADLGWIVAMGVLGGSGVLCLTLAYRRTEPSNLAPFDFFAIVFAFALGWIFFGEAPFERLFPGVLFIVGGGLMIVWRERRRT